MEIASTALLQIVKSIACIKDKDVYHTRQGKPLKTEQLRHQLTPLVLSTLWAINLKVTLRYQINIGQLHHPKCYLNT